MADVDMQTIETLYHLRLIIARAGQNDSLQWWEDDALTQNGRFLLGRIFPGIPSVAGRNLALAAAISRHSTALSAIASAVYLYRIDNHHSDQPAIREILPSQSFDLIDPIPTLDALRQRLLTVVEREPVYDVVGKVARSGALQIRIAENSNNTVAKAQALAWAYLEGKVSQTVFPYIVESV